MSELKEDFDLLFKNAFTYYKKTAQEYKDATELSDLFGKALGKLMPYMDFHYCRCWGACLPFFYNFGQFSHEILNLKEVLI